MFRWNACAAVIGALGVAGSAVHAAPVDGKVVGGSASIRSNGTQTDIVQTSARAVIDWTQFSIGVGESVHFRQPDARSSTLNRVTGGDPSQILGSLTATGQVMLLNRNGVLFGREARVDTAGLIVSTATLGTADFMAGRLVFGAGDRAGGSIVNQGSITVREGGLAAFVAPHVRNDGVIQADLGRVVLASGSSFVVDMAGDGLMSLAIRESDLSDLVDVQGHAVNALVENTGSLVARSGQILVMTPAFASRLVDNAINLGGVVRADTTQRDASGAIVLSAANGAVTLGGELAAPGGTFALRRDAAVMEIDAGTADAIGRVLRTGTHVSVHTSGTLDVSARVDGRGAAAGAGLSLTAAGIHVSRDIALQDGAFSARATDGSFEMNRPGGRIEQDRIWPLIFTGSADIRLSADRDVKASHLVTSGNVDIESIRGKVHVVTSLGADMGGQFPLRSLRIRALGNPEPGKTNYDKVGSVAELYDVTVAAGGVIDVEASHNIQIQASSTRRAGLLAARSGTQGRQMRLYSHRLGEGELARDAWYWQGTNSRINHAARGNYAARADGRWYNLSLNRTGPVGPTVGAPPGPTSAFAPSPHGPAELSQIMPLADAVLPDVLPSPLSVLQGVALPRSVSLAASDGHAADPDSPDAAVAADGGEATEPAFRAYRGVAAIADTGRPRTTEAPRDVFSLNEHVVQLVRCATPAVAAHAYFTRNVFGQPLAVASTRCP